MSERPDMPPSDVAVPTRKVSVVSQPVAAGMFDAPDQELSVRTQPLTHPSAQSTAPSGWWLLPAVVAGAAIWALIIWWLL